MFSPSHSIYTRVARLLQALLSPRAPVAASAGTVNLAQFETFLPAARTDTGSRLLDDVRRELADLRATVRQQQDEIARQRQEIAKLKGRRRGRPDQSEAK